MHDVIIYLTLTTARSSMCYHLATFVRLTTRMYWNLLPNRRLPLAITRSRWELSWSVKSQLTTSFKMEQPWSGLAQTCLGQTEKGRISGKQLAIAWTANAAFVLLQDCQRLASRPTWTNQESWREMHVDCMIMAFYLRSCVVTSMARSCCFGFVRHTWWHTHSMWYLWLHLCHNAKWHEQCSVYVSETKGLISCSFLDMMPLL